jgi:hypothetical protein
MGILRRLQVAGIDPIDATPPDRRFSRAAKWKRQDQVGSSPELAEMA